MAVIVAEVITSIVNFSLDIYLRQIKYLHVSKYPLFTCTKRWHNSLLYFHITSLCVCVPKVYQLLKLLFQVGLFLSLH